MYFSERKFARLFLVEKDRERDFESFNRISILISDYSTRGATPNHTRSNRLIWVFFEKRISAEQLGFAEIGSSRLGGGEPLGLSFPTFSWKKGSVFAFLSIF